MHEFSVVDITMPREGRVEFGTTIGVIETNNVPSPGDYISLDVDGDNDEWSQHYVIKRVEWYASRIDRTKTGTRDVLDSMDLTGLTLHVEPITGGKTIYGTISDPSKQVEPPDANP